jgi:hypothetical protein
MVPPETPPEPRRCKARSRKNNGEQCRKPPMHGQDVCGTHGGKAPRALAAAERRMAEVRAAKAVATFGLPREINPRDALLEEVYRTAGAIDWLHSQILELEARDVIWGVTEEVSKTATEYEGVDTTHAASINVWVELWQKERKHLVDVSKAALGAGIEERRVKLAEQQGALLAGVIKAVLGDLELTPEQAARAPRVVADRLRDVSMSLN